jgi:(p)ppGpp synthase/HD superfamily hydrolase
VEAHAKPVFLRAVAFAVAKHGAVQQARKGTSFPYVVHPLRVGETLDRFGETEDVVVAGLLHDVTEDAGVTQHELSLEFGPRVAELVRKASELDPTLPWQERKERTVERVRAETDREALAVVAADKLDNAYSLQNTLRARGEATWAIFNAPRDAQRWYYTSLVEALMEKEPANPLFRLVEAEVRALFADAAPAVAVP